MGCAGCGGSPPHCEEQDNTIGGHGTRRAIGDAGDQGVGQSVAATVAERNGCAGKGFVARVAPKLGEILLPVSATSGQATR
jgi:hypothetical protein